MEPFKWGMIGSEERAKRFSAEANYTTHTQILKAFLPTGKEASYFSEFTEVNVCHDISELLQTNINAVYIASSTGQHFDQISQCLKNGMPVLCERPITGKPSQLAELIRLAQHYHTFLMEALWMRFMPVLKKIFSIINSDLVGTVESIRASVYYKDAASSMPACSDIGGGVLSELGIYPVFLSTLFLGKPSYIKSTGQVNELGEDESFTAFLSYDDGKYAIIEASLLVEKDSVLTIMGDKGHIHIRNPWSVKPDGIEVELADGTKMIHKSEWKGMGLYFEMDEVYSCIQQDLIESPFYCHEFTLDVSNVISEIRSQLVK